MRPYAKRLLRALECLGMGDGLTFAEQSCRSGPRLEFGDVYAIDCERISQKFSHAYRPGRPITDRHHQDAREDGPDGTPP